MANTIKGLTVEIGGDTTKLGKALENVNKKSRGLSTELGQINRLLKLDPGNADLLAQKQQVLAVAISNTREKLDTLKEAERQVQAQFERGEISEAQYREFQREIVATEQKLGRYERAAQETADAVEQLSRETSDAGDDISTTGRTADAAADDLDDLGDAAEHAGDGLDVAGVAAGTFLGNLAKSALDSIVSGLQACIDVTHEYKTAMGKLDTAFTTNGHSTTAATDTYKELVSVLGETDRSVEAANHLAVLTDNEKDLSTWTDICTGIFATFGDSLPIEGLTEAANETAKVGQVTGPLADAINWATMSTEDWGKALGEGSEAHKAFAAATAEGESAEDAFNAALAECSDEQERQQLIMNTLNGLYSEASATYKETNADVIAANAANEAWTASMAAVGQELTPLVTEVKSMGAELLEKAVPAIQWVKDNLPTVAAVLASVTAGIVAQKIAQLAATAATNGMTIAQYAAAAAQKALNAAMKANPIGLIITALGLLVTAFVYLWKNNEDFRKFWLDLWAKIKDAALKAGERIRDAVEKLRQKITEFVDKVKTAFNSIKTFVTVTVPGFFTSMKNKAVSAVTTLYNNVVSWFKSLPSSIQTHLTNAVNKVATWGTNMTSKAKAGMSKVVSAVTDKLKELPGKVLSIGGDLVTGLWNGVNNKVDWLIGKIGGFTKTVLNRLKGFFGEHSPSKYTAEMGEYLDEGLANGIEDAAGLPIKAARNMATGVLGAAGGVDGLALDRQLASSQNAARAATGADIGVLGKLDAILSAIERGQILTIDSDALVGATADKYDRRLGQQRALAARGMV